MKYDGIFIGVNYDSTEETLNWIKSIKNNAGNYNYKIIVVDTSGEKIDPEIKSKISKIGAPIEYINPNSNLGYFGGARFGIQYIKQNNYIFDFLVVSNVDLLFDSKEFVGVILKNIGEDIGVLAPSIISNQMDLNPYKIERLTLAQIKRRILYMKSPHLQWIVDIFRSARKKQKTKVRYPSKTKMYAAYGACFIFSKYYFEKGADIDLPLFLYGEEIYVAEQCQEHGLEILYIPEIVISNIGKVSTGKLVKRIKNQYYIDSYNYCIEKYYKS